ncbi:uncharacterized protein UHOD_01328 [Ustilago sp. UG-2017b]|nr:uncharacterized protein UHOD_01328 [Ustilago sp. UG-2017b]
MSSPLLSRYQLAQHEAYFLVAALSSIIVIALCLGNAQADTVATPLGLTQVDDKGAPITPLTYLNLEPASKELSDAAKKVTTPPPMTKQKRLVPSASDHLEPFAKQFTSQGISIRELGSSLIPSLPLLGALDNEGDHTNAKPPAEVPAVEAPAAQKRLLDVLKSLDLPDSGRVMPANQQTLDQRTSHPLNRRADDPLNLNILGKKPTGLLPKLPTKRDDASGINLFGHEIPLDAIALPSRSTGNEQDMDRAKSFLGVLLPIKRDTISPENVDLSSVKGLGEGLAAKGAQSAVPLALSPVKQAASPAVQGIKTANALCTSFGCQQAVQGAVAGVTKELPVPVPVARANGLLNNGGSVSGVPVKRGQDPLSSTVLDTSDVVRDNILDLKTQADNAAGSLVKNMYSEHGQIETKRALNLSSYSLLPGSGPEAKEAIEDAKDVVDFVGLPVRLPGLKRMAKIVKRSA